MLEFIAVDCEAQGQQGHAKTLRNTHILTDIIILQARTYISVHCSMLCYLL